MGQPDYILDQFGKPRDAAMLISLSSVVCETVTFCILAKRLDRFA